MAYKFYYDSNEEKCGKCGDINKQIDDGYGNISDDYYCCNIKCESNLGDDCPICHKTRQMMGDERLLFDCAECSYIWSYHDDCPELSNPSMTPSEFIGHLTYPMGDSDSDGDDFSLESHELEKKKQFIYSDKPFDIPYEDCTRFAWKCSRCNEKYVNMYCG